MAPTRTNLLVSRFGKGQLSAAEVANALLFDLVSEPQVDVLFLSSSFQTLPDEIKQSFKSLLSKIESSDFRWTPFFLSSTKSPAEDYSEKLRHILAALP